MLTPAPEPLMPAPGTPIPTSRPAPDPQVGESDTVYLSGRVPKSLRDDLRHQAIHEGRPTADLLKDAVQAYLDKHTRT